jgi:O-acetyl-ADP-ribose deacetylase (regulator of RNase III)
VADNITFKQGSIFESNMQTLTNTVNTTGVMGKGIAKEFKSKFPAMFLDYKNKCKLNLVVVGEPYLWIPRLDNQKWVLNFPTKKHWSGNSKAEWIEQGLNRLVKNYKDWGILSLAIPALGSGLGNLKWQAIQPLMESYLGCMDIPIEIYEPLSHAKSKIHHIDHDSTG